MDPKAHWDRVYQTQRSTDLSWFEPLPTRSLGLIVEAGAGPESEIIDVGGGDSTLVDALVERHLGRITVLDVSGTALERAKLRLGQLAEEVKWLEADITRATLPANAYEVWHDRAVFHFLVEGEDRRRYVEAATHALRPGGTLIVATFASDGPARCSGLPVVRYSPQALAREFGTRFEFIRGFGDVHRTPSGTNQHLTFVVLRRR